MKKNDLIIVRTVLKNTLYQIDNIVSYLDDNSINEFYDINRKVSDKNISPIKERYFKLCILYDEVCKRIEGD